MTTPTKPTINQILINCHVWYECPCRDCEKSLKEAKSQLLQLVLDEVIIKDLPHVMGKCNKKWCYCSAYAINATLKHLKQRAREILT